MYPTWLRVASNRGGCGDGWDWLSIRFKSHKKILLHAAATIEKVRTQALRKGCFNLLSRGLGGR